MVGDCALGEPERGVKAGAGDLPLGLLPPRGVVPPWGVGGAVALGVLLIGVMGEGLRTTAGAGLGLRVTSL